MRNDRENKIDNYFLEGLDGLNIIPPADSWNNIAERLPKKSRKPSMFVWIAMAASFTLFAMVGGWLYYQNQEMNSEISTQMASSKTQNQESFNKGENIAEVKEQSSNVKPQEKIVENQTTKKADAVSNQKSAPGNSYKSTTSTRNKTIAANSEVEKNSKIIAEQPTQDKITYASNQTNAQTENVFMSDGQKKSGNSVVVKENNVGKKTEIVVNSKVEKKSEIIAEQLPKDRITYASSQANAQTESVFMSDVQKNDENSIVVKENKVGKKPEESFALLAPIAAQNIEGPFRSTAITKTYSKIVIDTMPVYESLYAYENIPEEKEKKDRWAIGGQMAPLYSYRDLKDVNSYGLSKSEINEIEKGVVTYSSGIVVDFEASSRLTFQTGLNYMKWGQEIDNISQHDLSLMKSAYVPRNVKGNSIPVVNSAGVIYDESSSAGSTPMPVAASNAVNYQFGPGNMPLEPVNLDYKDIKQSFEFLEVPFLAKYKIINRKLNVHLLGGVSTHFLVNDKSIIKTGDNVTTEGETQKVQTLNYSSSVGFGVVYNLSKNIKFSIEPTFKYYLNSFNSDDNVQMHPYTIGLYSGLLFRF